jgi:hypothetical protein
MNRRVPMPRDKVHKKDKAKTDTTWKQLMEACESKIKLCQSEIKTLRKSLIYFRRQEASGIQFPLSEEIDNREIS